MDEKIVIKIKQILQAIHDDVSYSKGGWFFFFSRLSFNAMMLYYMLGFLNAFFMFSFRSYDIITPEELKIVRVLLWASGVIYMLMRMDIWKDSIAKYNDTIAKTTKDDGEKE